MKKNKNPVFNSLTEMEAFYTRQKLKEGKEVRRMSTAAIILSLLSILIAILKFAIRHL